MDSCPSEILGLIFAEACTDDGRTGRSLSSVSQRVRCASRRYALQSVALYGHDQVSTFASLLDRVDPEDRRVCHLYLTDRRRVLTEYPRDQTREEWLKERISEGTPADSIASISSPSAILRILTTISPILQTLTLLLFHRYEEPIFSDALHVPELRDLTIHSSTLFRSTFVGPPLPPQCPRLQRLHVVQDFLLGRGLMQSIASIAPLLTHLRISDIFPDTAWPEDGIVRGLGRMVARPAADGPNANVPSTATGKFPPTLERFLIQLANQKWLGPMTAQLKQLAMRDARRRVVLLKPAKKVKGATSLERTLDVPFYMGIRAAWEERIGGVESAVWDVEPSAILASYGYSAEGEN